MSNPPSWGDIGTRGLRVAKIKVRELQQAATGTRNTVQSNPRVAGALKTVGTVGKVAKVGVPAIGGLLDAGIGLAEGEDLTRAAAGAVGSTGGGLAGAWGGAAAGAAIGAPLAPFTFGLSSAAGGVIGGVAGAVGGSLLGGWGADRVDQAVRGQQPIDVKRQQAQANATAPASSTPTPSYKPINGAFKPDPNATYSYQPMKPDGSGGFVTQGGTMPAPVAGAGQQQRGQLQPVSFNPGGNGKPNTVNAGGATYLQGFEPGGRNSTFTESAAAGAPQTPSPQNGQLVKVGFNPLPAMKMVIPGAGKAAAPAAAAGGAKLPFNPVVEFVKEGAKQLAFLPILGAAGLLYRPGAPPPAAAPANAANLRYANPSPAGWDRALFGGWFNDNFGPGKGFEYQKLDAENKRQNRKLNMQEKQGDRKLDVQENLGNRKIDAGVYNTDTKAGTDRRGQDLRIAGQDMVSGRQLQGTQYTADKRLEGVGMTNATNLRRTGLQYGPGGSTDRGYASNERRTTQTNQTKIATTAMQHGPGGSKDRGYASNEKREVIKGEYKIGNTKEQNKGRLENTGLQNQGKVQVATIGYMGKVDSATINADGRVRTAGVTGSYKVAQEGVKQSGAANVAGIKAGATIGAAGLAAGAKVDSAKIALQGTGYKADATVKVASIKASSATDAAQAKAESEGSKAAASFVANLDKSTANSMATEDKARIARYRSLGIY